MNSSGGRSSITSSISIGRDTLWFVTSFFRASSQFFTLSGGSLFISGGVGFVQRIFKKNFEFVLIRLQLSTNLCNRKGLANCKSNRDPQKLNAGWILALNVQHSYYVLIFFAPGLLLRAIYTFWTAWYHNNDFLLKLLCSLLIFISKRFLVYSQISSSLNYLQRLGFPINLVPMLLSDEAARNFLTS